MTPQRPNVGSLNKNSLHPEWIVGFIDGEGCFHIGISRHADMRFGRQILPELTVVQHQRDLALLHQLRSHFGCGVVRRNHGDRYCWRVRDLEQLLDRVCPFFEAHPLKSKKAVAFRKFAKVVYKMAKGDHLQEEGFCEIIKIAQGMNRGETNIQVQERVHSDAKSSG